MELSSSGRTWKYLPDLLSGVNETQVFIKRQVSPDIPTIEAAFWFLRDQCQFPLLLKKKSPDGLTVVLEASRNSEIVFGRSVPTGNPEEDVREIIAVLVANGLHVRFIG